MAPEYPFFLAGQWRKSDQPLEVISPYDGQVVGVTFYATAAHLEEATRAAQEAFPLVRNLPAYERAAILARIAQGSGSGRRTWRIRHRGRTPDVGAIHEQAPGDDIWHKGSTSVVKPKSVRNVGGRISGYDWR